MTTQFSKIDGEVSHELRIHEFTVSSHTTSFPERFFFRFGTLLAWYCFCCCFLRAALAVIIIDIGVNHFRRAEQQ